MKFYLEDLSLYQSVGLSLYQSADGGRKGKTKTSSALPYKYVLRQRGSVNYLGVFYDPELAHLIVELLNTNEDLQEILQGQQKSNPADISVSFFFDQLPPSV